MGLIKSSQRHGRPLAATAILVLLAVLGLGCGEASDPGPAEPAGADATAVAIPAVTALNRPQQKRDVIPRQIARQAIMRGALDLGSARLARGFGRMLWLARSTDGASICVVATGSLSCASLEMLGQRGFGPSISWRHGEPVRIAGVATDGVKHVDVTLADGHVRRVAVAGNALSLTLRETPRELSWQGPSGRERQRIPNAALREPLRQRGSG